MMIGNVVINSLACLTMLERVPTVVIDEKSLIDKNREAIVFKSWDYYATILTPPASGRYPPYLSQHSNVVSLAAPPAFCDITTADTA